MALVPTKPNSTAVTTYNGRSAKEPHSCFQSLSYTPLPPKDGPPPRTMGASPRRRQKQPDPNLPPLPTDQLSIRSVIRVAASWRGYMVRRQLKSLRIWEEYKGRKIVKVQCFIRCVKARAELRRRQVQQAEAVAKLKAEYQVHQLTSLMPQLQWQRAAMDRAAREIQVAFRWHVLKEKCLAGNDPVPEYVSYRARLAAELAEAEQEEQRNGEVTPSRSRSKKKSSGSPMKPGADGDEASRSYAGQVVPWSPPIVHYDESTVEEQEVLRYNAELRYREAQKAQCQLQEYSVQRHHSNWDAIRAQDMDGCAAIIQRRWRSHIAETTVSTRRITGGYYDRYACIIQRAVRCHNAKRNASGLREAQRVKSEEKMKLYNSLQLEEMAALVLWSRHTAERAALCVQRAYRYFKHQSGSRPPYGLLDDTKSPFRCRNRRTHHDPEPEPEPTSPGVDEQADEEGEDDVTADAEKELAVMTLQAASRRAQAKEEVSQRRSRSQERARSRESDSRLSSREGASSDDSEKEKAARTVQGASRRAKAKAEVRSRSQERARSRESARSSSRNDVTDADGADDDDHEL